MRLTVYKILPYWLEYTNEGLSVWEGGRTSLLSIKIKPQYKSDFSLLMHEIEHIKQTYKTCFLHGLLYATNKRYKLYAECQAFIAGQLKYKTMTVEQVATALYNSYNLGFTYDYILNYLEGLYEKSLPSKN